METSGQRYYEAELHRLRGEILLAQRRVHPGRSLGDDTGADEALVRALDLATARGSQWLALRAATSLGRLRRSQDRLPEARRLVDAAVAGIGTDRELPDAAAALALQAALHGDRARSRPRPPRRR